MLRHLIEGYWLTADVRSLSKGSVEKKLDQTGEHGERELIQGLFSDPNQFQRSSYKCTQTVRE